MKLYEHLKDENILLDLRAKTKEEAIIELSVPLKAEKDVIDFDRFIADVFKREEMTSTGIGYGLAVPHAQTSAVRNIVIGLGRSRGGVEFNSVDGKPAVLIFLIGAPEGGKSTAYLKLLGHLSRILKKEDFRKKLLAAERPQDIINQFKKVES